LSGIEQEQLRNEQHDWVEIILGSCGTDENCIALGYKIRLFELSHLWGNSPPFVTNYPFDRIAVNTLTTGYARADLGQLCAEFGLKMLVNSECKSYQLVEYGSDYISSLNLYNEPDSETIWVILIAHTNDEAEAYLMSVDGNSKLIKALHGHDSTSGWSWISLPVEQAYTRFANEAAHWIVKAYFMRGGKSAGMPSRSDRADSFCSACSPIPNSTGR
jgi:hypothetical protein